MSSRVEARAITGEADARACLAAMEASAGTLVGWCRNNGVSPTQLYRWRQLVAGLDGRGIQDEADARALLESWANSGRSFAEWCRAEKVSMEGLYQWRRRIRAQGRQRTAVARQAAARDARAARTPAIRLVEVVATPRSTAPPEAVMDAHAVATYEVCVGRCRVRLGDAFDDGVLARILRVAAAC